MPDTRSNRGPHPRDDASFAENQIPRLQQANRHLCWLLSHGYSPKAALKLVGDRFNLRDRQRRALQRCAAGDDERLARRARRIELQAIRRRELVIDGYNVLLTVEAALSDAVLLLARDGTMRDLASMSRHYKKVSQTRAAIVAIGETLAAADPSAVVWILDRPISNSGRLRALLQTIAAERGWPWRIDLEANADRTLILSSAIVASADSAVLDRCGPWINLARRVVEERVADPWLVDLTGDRERSASSD